MFPRSPGPSSTVRGRPVSTTGSPGRTPDVSSYTWIVVLSPVILMTSPMSCSAPTRTTSYILGERPAAVMTGPATRVISPTPLAFTSAFPVVATPPTSFEQVDSDGPPNLRPQVLRLRGPDRDDDGPGHGLKAAPHRVAQLLVVARVEDEDPDLRVREHLGDLRLNVVLRRARRLPDPHELEPLDEVVPAHGRELHVTPPGGP